MQLVGLLVLFTQTISIYKLLDILVFRYDQTKAMSEAWVRSLGILLHPVQDSLDK
jgi:hypothetical protein